MKSILFTIMMVAAVAAVTVTAAYGQTAANRTAKTKISDGLALLPAPNAAEYRRIMQDFVSTEAEGVDMLTQMFTSTNDVQVSYALSGWAAYVSAQAPTSAERKTFNEGIVRALDASQDRELKAFYIRLLQVSGTDDNVLVLAAYISDDYLGQPAIAALKAIGTPSALAAVLDGMPAEKSTEKSGQKFTSKLKGAKLSPTEKLAAAVEQQGKAAMPQILKALDSKDRAYRNAALYLTDDFVDQSVLAAVAGKMSKAPAETKVDIVNYLGRHRFKDALPQIIQYMGNENSELNAASMWAATRIGGQGVPDALATVLKDQYATPEMRNTAIACLASYEGDVADQLAFVVEQGSASGKILALNLIGEKRLKSKASVVMDATQDSEFRVVDAAYKALPSVAGYNQFYRLGQMLDQNPDPRLDMSYQVQLAVVEALAGQSEATRIADIKEKMSASPRPEAWYAPLASVGTQEAMAELMAGYEAGDDSRKHIIFEALFNFWPSNDRAILDKLYSLVLAENNRWWAYMLSSRIESAEMTAEMKTIWYSDILAIMGNPASTDFAAETAEVIGNLRQVPCFQSLMLAGRYLESTDADMRQAAVDAVRVIGLSSRDYYGPVVKELLVKADRLNTGPDKTYQHEEITTFIGEMPDGGYVSMFNGTDYTGWKGLVKNPIERSKMSPAELAREQVAADERMRRDWKIRDGLMIFEGSGYDNICTEKEYGDFEMYVDWLLYAEGSEADGGIYLRGTPQVQMWDTARTNVGAQVGSGGLYNNEKNPSKPLKVADNTLGRWNTFHIKMVGERVTVTLNGEVVTDNVILENFWDRSLPIPMTEQIEFQAHGTRIAYRNLYINELPRPEPFVLPAEEKAEGYRVLFDGTTMNEWTGNTADYVTENGTITLYPSNGHGGNLYTKDEFSDFVLRFEFKLTPGANNGLGVRTPTEGDAAYVGMELQIIDNDAPIYSMLEKYQYHGSVYGVIAAKRGFLKPPGEWNYQEVYIRGYDIRITLNGEVILEGNLSDASAGGTKTLDKLDHPGLLNKSGHLAFLGHGSEVSFRNIRIREM